MIDKVVEKNMNGYCKECVDDEGITSIKLSRRDFVKVASAGTLYLALPGVVKIPTDLRESVNPKSDLMDSDPLIVVVKNNELVGFRGLEEFTVKDNGLVEELSSRHMDEPDSKYSEDEPVVILVKEGKPIKFRGLREFALEDSDLGRRLSSKFKSKVGG